MPVQQWDQTDELQIGMRQECGYAGVSRSPIVPGTNFRKEKAKMIGGIKIWVSPFITNGHVALKRGNDVIWHGPWSTPLEDVDFDGVVMSEADYEDLKTADLNAPTPGADFIRKVLGPLHPKTL